MTNKQEIHGMQDVNDGTDAFPAFTIRAAELAVALLIAIIGIVVMIGSHEQGIGWSEAGPDAGYFPFRIGLLLCLASGGTIALTLRNWAALKGGFVARGPFKHVVTVFVPMCLYGIGIRLLGMYVASALFIAWFMWQERGEARRGPVQIAVVSVAVVVAAYFIFERWFQVPLYAGPFAVLFAGR